MAPVDSERVEKLVAQLVEQVGLVLYDFDVPITRGANGRVFITQSDGSAVTIDDCVKVGSLLRDSEDLEEAAGDCAFEVSSPGVERKLSKIEHFVGGIGEEVLVKITENGSPVSIRGKLSKADSEKIEILSKGEAARAFEYDQIQEARVVGFLE